MAKYIKEIARKLADGSYENIAIGKQSDWNQNNETEIDYIKNRTHYMDDIQSLPLGNTTLVDSEWQEKENKIYFMGSLNEENIDKSTWMEKVLIGDFMQIEWNGQIWTCEVKVSPYSYNNYYIGNIALVAYGDGIDPLVAPYVDTNEPFLFIFQGEEPI